jgi:hypothetical protein
MIIDAGWSSPVACQAHNLKVAGSNLAPATTFSDRYRKLQRGLNILGDALNSKGKSQANKLQKA